MCIERLARGVTRTLRFGSAAVLAVVLTAGSVRASGTIEGQTTQKDEGRGTPATPTATVAEKWGIQVSGIFLSARGNLVDFRYRVLDPAKAALLTRTDVKPELLNPANGVKLVVPDTPKAGALRQTVREPVAGKTYFILFANTRHHVKSGDKVTLIAGDVKLEDLVVE